MDKKLSSRADYPKNPRNIYEIDYILRLVFQSKFHKNISNYQRFVEFSIFIGQLFVFQYKFCQLLNRLNLKKVLCNVRGYFQKEFWCD